jgi:hypothetical protein
MIMTEGHRTQEDKPVRVTEGEGLLAHRGVQDVHTILGKELIVNDIGIPVKS